MAKGKKSGSRLVLVLFLTLVTLVCSLLTSLRLIDPLDPLNFVWRKLTVLSDPAPAWQARVAGVPDLGAVLPSGAVVAYSRGYVEVYQAATGKQLWRRQVHFALPAGDVVVIRQRPENPDADPSPDVGYAVVDPPSGTVLWSDRDALAVWAFSNQLVDLTCPSDCVLRARSHRDNGAILWTVALPAQARIVHGGDPPLAGTRDPAEWFDRAAAGLPGPMPPVIALPVNDQIHVIDAFNGTYVRAVSAPDRETRVAFSGDRLLFIKTHRAQAGCVFAVDAYDFRTNELRWHEDGFDLGTASGAGCEQRADPLGTGGQLIVGGSDGRPRLVTAESARQVWVGVPGERVLASDGLLAVVSGADRQTLSVVNVGGEDPTVAWSGQFGLDAEAAITPELVLIRDPDARKLMVFRRIGMGLKLELSTRAEVLGVGTNGLLLVNGRAIGYLPVPR